MNLALIAALVFFAAVVINALLAGYQTGFLIVDRIRLHYLASEDKNPRASLLLKRMSRPDWVHTTILLTTATALIAGTVALARILVWDFLAVLIAAPVFLVLSEIIPRSIFRRHPERMSLALAPALRIFEIVFMPLIWPAILYTRALRVLTGTSDQDIEGTLTSEADFRLLVDESAAAGSIEKDEQELIHNVMDLQRTPAKDIMVPRTEMKAIADTASLSELISVFQETSFTRLPVYRDSIDHVIGVANVYDVLLDSASSTQGIARFIKDIHHVPDTMPAADVLQRLKDSRQHMAIVINEYGITDGLITLEDVLEEIFGEINDEHDHDTTLLRKVGANAYVVDARMPLADLHKAIRVPIPEDHADTVAGWVMQIAGRIPEQGEKIKHRGFRVTVLETQQNVVSKIRLDVLREARMPESPTTD